MVQAALSIRLMQLQHHSVLLVSTQLHCFRLFFHLSVPLLVLTPAAATVTPTPAAVPHILPPRTTHDDRVASPHPHGL